MHLEKLEAIGFLQQILYPTWVIACKNLSSDFGYQYGYLLCIHESAGFFLFQVDFYTLGFLFCFSLNANLFLPAKLKVFMTYQFFV